MEQAGVLEIPPHLDNVLKNAEGTEEKRLQDKEQGEEERVGCSALVLLPTPLVAFGPRS